MFLTNSDTLAAGERSEILMQTATVVNMIFNISFNIIIREILPSPYKRCHDESCLSSGFPASNRKDFNAQCTRIFSREEIPEQSTL